MEGIEILRFAQNDIVNEW